MSVQITPTLIKKLRDRTGIGMTKCKEALETSNGDIEVAIANLRKAGMASAVKKEGRETNEGMIGTATSGDTVAIVEVNAETDFVVKNERFQEFLNAIAKEIAETTPASLDVFLQQKYSKDPSITIDDFRATIVQAIGENVQISRLQTFPKGSSHSVGVYSHLGGKIVTAVEIEGASDEEDLAKDIAMHIAAAAPEFVSPEEVPESVINHEKEIIKSQIKGKPEDIVEKIISGKINAYYDDVCLTRQKFIKDDSKTISSLVEDKAKATGKPMKIKRFIRWSVGQA